MSWCPDFEFRGAQGVVNSKRAEDGSMVYKVSVLQRPPWCHLEEVSARVLATL